MLFYYNTGVFIWQEIYVFARDSTRKSYVFNKSSNNCLKWDINNNRGAVSLNTSYRLYELQGKEIINISDGRNIGRICDVEIEGITGGIIHIVVPGKPKYFGLFGRGEDVFIPWGKIKLIGIDSILIDYPELYSKADRLSKSSIWSKIFD